MRSAYLRPMDLRRRQTTALDDALSVELTKRCVAARDHLRGEMLSLGLFPEEGWRIAEKTRFADGHTEIVFWPIHNHLPSPPGVECIVSIDESGESIRNTCDPVESVPAG